jgi:hypothetical protein
MRTVNPSKPVLVHRDGRWLDGDLRAWRCDVDGWLGYVCYVESAGSGTWSGRGRAGPRRYADLTVQQRPDRRTAQGPGAVNPSGR